jgi:hypothetical protein
VRTRSRRRLPRIGGQLHADIRGARTRACGARSCSPFDSAMLARVRGGPPCCQASPLASAASRASSARLAASSSSPRSPVHGGLERALPRDGGSRASGEQAEPVVEPRLDLLRCQYGHACCGQLDRQRNAIETLANACDRPCLPVSGAEGRIGRDRWRNSLSRPIKLVRSVGRL